MSKKARPAILKNTLIAFALTFFNFCPEVAFAGGQECMASYYRTKSPACVEDILTQLRQVPPSSRKPDTLVGFLAQLFKASPPQERERILKAEPSDYIKTIDLYSLYLAGLPADAEKFATANNLSPLLEKLRTTRLATLDALRPSSIPGDNDLLIGAYMASGDTALIQRILDNYSTADDGMVSDALRMGLLKSKFGNSLAPKERESVTAQAACAKYQCKTDPVKFLRLLTLSSAFWALQSLAERDDGIKKTLAGFFDRDKHLKDLLVAEQTSLGNYMTALLVLVAIKSDHTGAEREQAYAAMSKSASIYENLGPANEAFAPFTSLKK